MFLEWTFAQHEVERLCGVQPFKCPACSPSMHVISVDGNRKQYRFHNAHGYVFYFILFLCTSKLSLSCFSFCIKLKTEKGYFDGTFIMKDNDVSSFVEYVYEKTKHVNNP